MPAKITANSVSCTLNLHVLQHDLRIVFELLLPKLLVEHEKMSSRPTEM
jgi:hypothetical protein